MKKEQFKKMLKPIIKECIQEAFVESNLISGIISEVVKGMGAQPQQTQITEQKAKYESDEDAKKMFGSWESPKPYIRYIDPPKES